MKKVLIIQASLPHYRVHFFEKLHGALRQEDIRLRVAYGQPSRVDGDGDTSGTRDLPFGVRTRNYWLFGGRVLLQPLLRAIMDADLVIVEQANKHLVNYLLMVLSLLGIQKLAFWGHGWNRQPRGPSALSEKVKARLAWLPNWWFAYTTGAARYLEQKGVHAGEITVVQNSLDVKCFQNQLSEITDMDLERARSDLGLKPESVVGLYCGRLHRDKDIRFLMRASREVRRRVPHFRLLVIGDGPERRFVEGFAEKERWVHPVGLRLGREKALYFRLARAVLNPGAIGLGILDAFACGLPVITTDISRHGPEIDFFENGGNGVMSPPVLPEYAKAVVGVLTVASLYRRLSAGALASADRYSLEAMVENFKNGITQCLMHGK
jgi:glycosyltransferase involved in cell wall biosynthesis